MRIMSLEDLAVWRRNVLFCIRTILKILRKKEYFCWIKDEGLFAKVYFSRQPFRLDKDFEEKIKRSWPFYINISGQGIECYRRADSLGRGKKVYIKIEDFKDIENRLPLVIEEVWGDSLDRVSIVVFEIAEKLNSLYRISLSLGDIEVSMNCEKLVMSISDFMDVCTDLTWDPEEIKKGLDKLIIEFAAMVLRRTR